MVTIRRCLLWLVLVLVLVLGLAAALAVSFAGALHPVGDSVAAFRLHLAAAALMLYVLAWLSGAVMAERLAGLSFVTAAVCVVWLGLGGASPGPQTIRIVQHNVLWSNATPQIAAAQIVQAAADIVLLQEARDDRLLTALSPHYPHMRRCPRTGDNAVLSVYPLGIETCLRGVLSVPVETPLGPVTVASVHLPWPWPYGQEARVVQVAAALETLSGPVIVAGDFNSAPWSNAVRAIARASGTRLVRGTRLTFVDPRFWPGLPIDHILIPRGWASEVTLLTAAGSDHRATLARIGPVNGLSR